ncbi:MAG: chloride channel protein, partial [Chitinophagaceae bacterium]
MNKKKGSERKMSGAIPVAVSLQKEIFHPDHLDQKSDPITQRIFWLSLQAMINAIIIGFVAKILMGLIDLITNISFFGIFSFKPVNPGVSHLGGMVIFVPIVGGFLVGLLARFGSSSIRGHGIPEAMEQVLVKQSKIPPAITFLKPLASAIAIGTGGPFGAEGPIIATGGAFGSFAGQLMRISANERKIMLTAGAAAGMAAIFGSPVAAVLMAIELLLFEFSPRSIIPVALSCATAAAMHILLFGAQPVFNMPNIPFPSSIALITYVILGILIGVGASLVSKSVYFFQDLFEKLPIHWMWWPAIGSIVVGVVGYFAPKTMGVGYD